MATFSLERNDIKKIDDLIDQQLQDPEFSQAYQAAGEQVESVLALFNLEFKNMNSAPNPWHSKDFWSAISFFLA